MRGDQYGVCEAYRDYLSQHAPRFPGLCGDRWRRKPHATIGFPDWQQINTANSYPQILETVWDFLWERDANPATYLLNDMWRGTSDQHAMAYRNYHDHVSHPQHLSRSALASVDIDNDGAVDHIFQEKNCVVDNGLLIVLTDDMTDIDRQKTALVSRHLTWRTSRDQVYRPLHPQDDRKKVRAELWTRNLTLRESALRYASYNVFLHEGKTYFDLWWSAHPDFKGRPAANVGRLRVYRLQDAKTEEVCEFRVRPPFSAHSHSMEEGESVRERVGSRKRLPMLYCKTRPAQCET